MADIPVIFATNAGQVTPPIEGATAAIHKASGAQEKFQGTVGRTEDALSHLAGGFGRHIRSMLHVGGVLGTVGIAYFALEKALGVVEKAVERHDKKIEDAIKTEEDLEKQIKKTNMALSERGLSFGEKNGSAIRNLTASGGLDLAKQYTTVTGSFSEAAKATEEAQHKRFGGRSEEAMRIAARVANVTGESMSDVVKRMSVHDIENQEMDRLVRVKTGKNFYQSERAIESSKDIKALNLNNRNAGTTELMNLGLISQSALASGTARADAANPTMAFQVEQYQEAQKATAKLEDIARRTGLTNFLLEKISNASNYYAGTDH